MAKKEEQQKKSAPKKRVRVPAKVVALRTYRCGEPEGHSKAPPERIEKLMVKRLGVHARIVEGFVYSNLPSDLIRALINDHAVQEAR